MAGHAAATPPIDVLQFNARIASSDEDAIRVVEDILINAPTSGTNRGFFRDIPVKSSSVF